MTNLLTKSAAIALAASGLALATPAMAAAPAQTAPAALTQMSYAPAAGASILIDQTAEHHRGRHRDRSYRGRGRGYDRYDDRYDDRRYDDRYGEPVYRNTRVWEGRDGRYYCRKEDGTTGLLIGGAVGALAGRELAGRGDRTLGTILGAAGGALLGRAIDRSNSRCR